MIKNKKSNSIGLKKLQRKAIRIFNWSTNKPSDFQNFSQLGRSSSNPRLLKLISLKVGKVYTFKITALGPKNIGIDEFSYGYSIFLPNTQLGDVVKAKIVKIYNKTYKYAIAQVIKKIKTKPAEFLNSENSLNYNVGDILKVNILRTGPKNTGIAELSKNYFLIIPEALQGQNLKVQITRLKNKYGFAKILNMPLKNTRKNLKTEIIQSGRAELGFSSDGKEQAKTTNKNLQSLINTGNITTIQEGSKIQLLLPSNLKLFVKYVVLKINGVVLFVKPSLGAKPGDLVRIKCSKLITLNKKTNLAFGKIIQVKPMSVLKKRSLIQNNIRQMLQSGLHFGEKTVKCHARMKKYIWFRQKGPNKNKPLVQKGRNLINLLKTRRCLNKALIQLGKYALKGRTFLFVGTKKSATRLIARVSLFSKTSFFVNTRWLGGLLTNWKSILKSIKKIRPILKQKQTILKRILEKRQNIKNRLLLKAFILKNKSKVLIKKARVLLSNLKELSFSLSNSKSGSQEPSENYKKQFREKISQKALMLEGKRQQVLTTGEFLLDKSRKLLQKNYNILKNSLNLKDKAILIQNQYTNLLNELITNKKNLREFSTLLIISKQISQLQHSAKEQNTRLGIISYNKLKNLVNNSDITKTNWIIPNPPKEIINKIVLILKSQKDNPILFNNSLQGGIITEETKIDSVNNQISLNKQNLKNEILTTEGTQKVLILSKLLNQFASCLPFIEQSIQVQLLKNKELEEKLLSLKQVLNIIQNKINYYMNLKNKFTLELNKIKQFIKDERPFVRLVKRTVKKVLTQKKLIRFLPNLNFLPTPRIKINETVNYLITNIVDPKLQYPIEMIYDEKVKNMSKKVAATRKKRWQRLEKYFGGVAKMTKMKKNEVSKNIAIIIGQREEMNAIRECQKLGIKMFHILDTNCNPSLADHFIPANDDSRNSLEYLLKSFLVHIRLAQKLRLSLQKQKKSKNIRMRSNKTRTKRIFSK